MLERGAITRSYLITPQLCIIIAIKGRANLLFAISSWGYSLLKQIQQLHDSVRSEARRLEFSRALCNYKKNISGLPDRAKCRSRIHGHSQ